MSDQSSARLGLPYLAAGQLQKHVTLNESLTRLDALVQTAVQSRTPSSPPAEAADGALFILGGAGEGAWSGKPAGALMRRDMGGWVEVSAVEGQIAFVLDAQEIVIRGEDGWTPFSSAGGPPGEGVDPYLNVQRLGVGAEADEANPFSAKLNKALWAARGPSEGGDGDLRFTFNKVGASGVLSLLFQSGFSGRAEIGLVGDDDLKLKVSSDGAIWRDVFSVDRATGRAAFARGAARLETVVLAASTSFTPPAWARWLEVSAVGGGGGGGGRLRLYGRGQPIWRRRRRSRRRCFGAPASSGAWRNASDDQRRRGGCRGRGGGRRRRRRHRHISGRPSAADGSGRRWRCSRFRVKRCGSRRRGGRRRRRLVFCFRTRKPRWSGRGR